MSHLFSTHYKKILTGIIILSILLFLVSIIQIARNNITGFEPLVYGFGFFLYGAFNWADVFMFSLLWILLAIILLKMKQKEYFWIAYFSYWFIRSSGEVVFSLLQQFHPQTKPWLLYLPRAMLQNTYLGHFILVRYWVVEQIFFQSLAILSLFGLIHAAAKVFNKNTK